MPTALDIAKARQIPLSAGVLMALFTDSPFLASIDSRSSPDTKFLSMRVIALPQANGFINYGDGFISSDGEMKVEEFDCSLVGGQIKAELITSRKWDKLHVATGYTWFDLQTKLKFIAQGLTLESQIINGLGADAKGFPGLRDITPYNTVTVQTMVPTFAASKYTKSVLNLGGTTASTAQQLYALIEDEVSGVQLVLGDDMGGDNEMFKLEDMIISNEAPNPALPNNKSYHMVQQFNGHVGLSVAGMNQTPGSVIPYQRCLRRVANMTADSGHTCSEALMSKLRLSFGPNKFPTKYVTGSRSGEQLALDMLNNRTVMINMGAGDAKQMTAAIYPPPPEEYRGVPIVYADNSIGEADALES